MQTRVFMNAFRRTWTTVSVAAAALWVAAVGPGVSAHRAQPRAPRAMSLVDIAELPRALDPQLSPDGRFVVYALSHADWKANRPVFQLWRQEIGHGAPVQLTFADGGVTPAFVR